MNGDITSWLEEQGLGKYAATFVANEVDLVALPELTEEDLREMGVAIGARRKLLKAIRELADGADSQAPATMDASDAERRQLSVMFCDLVGSTELSTRIDAEDLRTLITRFQTGCAGAVEPLNGFVARYMGDGVMVYFGYP
ncbi:MAG: class 3 adenylate cyclase, partial [Gammaproteobacteria bacterium]